jgi:hypothetical protein
MNSVNSNTYLEAKIKKLNAKIETLQNQNRELEQLVQILHYKDTQNNTQNNHAFYFLLLVFFGVCFRAYQVMNHFLYGIPQKNCLI